MSIGFPEALETLCAFLETGGARPTTDLNGGLTSRQWTRCLLAKQALRRALLACLPAARILWPGLREVGFCQQGEALLPRGGPLPQVPQLRAGVPLLHGEVTQLQADEPQLHAEVPQLHLHSV